jgi:hypothetical protein
LEDEFDVCVRLSQGLVPLKPEDCRIKDSLWAFIQRCWEFVPKDRPTSIDALDFAEIEFRATLSTYTVKALTDDSTERIRKVQPDIDTPEIVDRKVKSLLNRLTMKRSISDQIIQWANKSVNERDVSAPPPSALVTARFIENFSEVEYPEGIKSPQVELNANSKDGRFRFADLLL